VLFSQAAVPLGWSVPNAGEQANAAATFDVQVQISGGTPASYNFCVTQLKPILSTALRVGAAG
jgi:hypothetical protein